MGKEFAAKTGLIVGGSSGIGKTVGRILLERGADAVLIVGTNEQKLRAAEIELGSFGKVITSQANIADSGQLDRLLAEIDGKFAMWICWSTAPASSSQNHSWNTPEKTTIDI